MSILHSMRMLAHHVGLEISRYPQTVPAYGRLKLLERQGVNVVLDVGANEGQYASELRSLGYEHRIVSFEPLSRAFEQLAGVAAKDPRWMAVRTAIGDFDGEAEINVAANSVSSSFLPMLERHRIAAPESQYVTVERVPMATLHQAAAPHVSPVDRIFIKIDAQGYNLQVLAGAKEHLLRRTVGLQVELSLVPLYQGEPLFQDALAAISEMEFNLLRLDAGFTDPRSGQVLQVDATFFR